MADNMGDDELRAELERYGEFVSKINDKTRPIYIKKLNHFKAREVMASKANDRQKKSPGRQSSRHSTAYFQRKSDDYEDNEANEDTSGVNERHLRRRTINLSRPSNVNGDHHEGRIRANRSPPRSPSRLQKPSVFPSSTPTLEVPKPCLPDKYHNPSINDSLFHRRLTSGDSNAGQTPPRHFGLLNKFLGGKVGEKVEGTRFPISRARGERSMTEFSDSEGENLPEMSTKAMNTSFPLDSSYERSPKFSPPSYSSLKHSGSRGGFGSSRLFESKELSKSSRSNDISRIVFFGVGLFFTVVTLVYFYNAFVVTPPPTVFISRDLVCVTLAGEEICLNERERNALDDVVLLLARRHGEVICGITRPESPDGFVAVSELVNHLQQKYEDVGLSGSYEVNVENLLILIQNRPDWNISIRCKEHPQSSVLNCSDSSIKNIVSLRFEKPMLSLICRIRRALKLVTLKILLCILSIVCLIGCIWMLVWLKRRKDKKTREVHSMANEIIGLLQNHASQCRNDPQVKPYLPVSHIRDALIPLLDRTRKAHIWNEAVKQLAENETRIVQEIQDVAGEETAVWRWNELTGIDLLGAKRTLDDSAGGRTPTSAPTLKYSSTPEMKRLNLLPFDSKLMSSCLKVYNLLPNPSPGNYMSEELRDAILDKCGQYHGILHIGCDYKIEEGVIFIKCISESAAHQNYKALHGWVFDDHVVSVKFVSPLVYKMIFADSEDAMVTLKSSTHRRRL